MRVAIIDGDTLSYRSAAASEERTVVVKHLRTGREKEFKNRTEFKEFLKSKGFEYVESDYTISDKQVADPEEYCYHSVKIQVDKIVKAVDAELVEVYVGGEGNFREKLELPHKYKGHRSDTIRPLLLDKTKFYVLNKYTGGLVTGYEADDHLHIRGYELLNSGHDPILCSQDKDARQAVNLKLYNWTLDNAKIESIPVFGELRYDSIKKKIVGEGLKWLCFQVVLGDSTDNYRPTDLCNAKFGQQSAFKLLKDTKTVDELFSAVEKQYQKWYPRPVTYTTWDGNTVTKDWKGLLDMYFSCAYMLREVNDQTTFDSLWKEFRT